MSDAALYAGMFISAFASATCLPGNSEAVLVGLLLAKHPPWLLVVVASAGNVLGSVINWILGMGVERFRERRWFPLAPGQLKRAQDWYARYGKWSLLLSWVPAIGDPLTLLAGVLRERFGVFLLLVAVAKTGRYLVLAFATLHMTS